jgi:SAM-dependent methyltransferase
VTAVEPDEPLAAFLVKRTDANPPLQVITTTFENADLAPSTFDLVACASAFHWLDEVKSLNKIASILKDGGHWAVWWNLLFDNCRTDELHRATTALFRDLDRAPSAATDGRPSFALDKASRIASLEAVQGFHNIRSGMISWTLTLDTEQVRGLYSTFSPISRLKREERVTLLDRVAQIVDQDFGGEAQIEISTPFYTAQYCKELGHS